MKSHEVMRVRLPPDDALIVRNILSFKETKYIEFDFK
jgi:hypothetical protein